MDSPLYPYSNNTDNSNKNTNLRTVSSDIDQVVQHAHGLYDNMVHYKPYLLSSDSNPQHDDELRPWMDEMIGKANQVLNALLRIRKQQMAIGQNLIINLCQIIQLLKRSTFQGRCHSCNISETPEWRRGPDGARTLCNACGLRKLNFFFLSFHTLKTHLYISRKLNLFFSIDYAKLARKKAAAAANTVTGSPPSSLNNNNAASI
ncbi:uncharacterized protein BX664DRAFT_253450 [Halteromyces radiatus]|uniref:uncharacterized protein n=1 Tax=Halteromyces radiatus TaxID=101107 RepID=UPI002220BAB2|nr:uncharacterized protein BX664DRAFT_253450 [Halteromyces radiatus]KAI8099452.1 hypothetical protein BX664DRAFT_253450 [Halteromyces radiatus]